MARNKPGKGQEGRFGAFLRAEKKEIKELCRQEEDFKHFALDSESIFKEYFIPHPGNCHKPRILRAKSLATILLVAVFLKAAVVSSLFLSYPQGAVLSVEVVSRVTELVNRDRAADGLAPLAANAVLEKSALAKAQDLVKYNYFAHESLDGKKPWDWIDRGQYAYLFVGENLAMNFTTAESVHQALMDSPSHKKNILNDKYTEVGISMVSGVIDGKETNVLVQHFATRQAPPVQLAATDNTVAGVTKPADVETAPSVTEVAGESNEKIDDVSPVTKPAVEPKAGEIPLPLPPAPPVLPDPAPVAAIIEAEKTALQTVSPEGPGQTEALPEPDKVAQASLPAEFDPAANLPSQNQVVAAANSADEHLVMTAARARLVNYFLLGIMAMLAVALLINIFVRWEIQHKHVIAQTLLVILVLGGLVFFRMHVMEAGLPDILLM